MLRLGDFTPRAKARRRRALVAGIVGLAATSAAGHFLSAGFDPTSSSLPTLDTAAEQITAVAPHVIVYSVPTKKPKKHHHSHSSGKSHGSHSDSDGDSGGDSDSGGTSVSNTVDGKEVGGASTYNNHTSGMSSSGSTSSPVQLRNNTGTGADSLASDLSSGVGEATNPGAVAAATSVVFMRVTCPQDQSAGTICFEATSSSGHATALPAASTATSALPANLPDLTAAAPSSAPAAVGQSVHGAAANLSSLEAKSGEHIELTGYSFEDNQGGNNAKISCPQIHQQAGGTGTYQDPITVASGGKSGGKAADGVKCGDRFYLPSVQRYVIVEDTGNTPNKSEPHLDMYVGNDPNKSCMNKISGTSHRDPEPAGRAACARRTDRKPRRLQTPRFVMTPTAATRGETR